MSTSLDWALTYIGRGWKPVPIATRTKAPKISNWPALRIKEADAPRFFARVCNIGIILGEASNGLVDLDLDCPEANELAPKHLPRTSTRFGRIYQLKERGNERIGQRGRIDRKEARG